MQFATQKITAMEKSELGTRYATEGIVVVIVAFVRSVAFKQLCNF